VWKKESAWQFCSMNLNVQVLTGEAICIGRSCTRKSVQQSADFVCIPTITFGCATAHELKHGDGGLRRIFSAIRDPLHRLDWVHVIQDSGGSLEPIKSKIKTDPSGAAALFPFYSPSRTAATHESKHIDELTKLQQKVYSLSKRIDNVTSQILGVAVTTARTIVHLATHHQRRGKMFEVLCRSLRIGFLVYSQCFLSTQGKELGMIEDLDIACLWLNRVSVRFVRENSSTLETGESLEKVVVDSSNSGGKVGASASSRGAYIDDTVTAGKSEGLRIHRDIDGVLVVDIEVSDEEELTVQFSTLK